MALLYLPARYSEIIDGVTWRSLPNFTHVVQEIWQIRSHIELQPVTKPIFTELNFL
jgi:hypothetical protein